MITFKRTSQSIKSAQLLESRARNIYPHISTSKIKTLFKPDEPQPYFYQKYADKITKSRKMIRDSKDLYSSVIYALQELKIGNCTEEAIFTELLGKINGQNNIYSGCIYIDNKKGEKKFINHAIAFITNKKIEQGGEYSFKNKDAIIIDPWLNITDYAGNYFNKIRTTFRKNFKNIPNNNFLEALLNSKTKTPSIFKKELKENIAPSNFFIIPYKDESLKNSSVEDLRTFFPELIIKNYNKIELPEKARTKSIEKK